MDFRSIAEQPLKGLMLTLEFAFVVFIAVAARGALGLVRSRVCEGLVRAISTGSSGNKHPPSLYSVGIFELWQFYSLFLNHDGLATS